MIEPQQNGHLNWHIMLYSSVLSPEMQEKAAAASSMALQSQIGKILESITCTTVPCDIHFSLEVRKVRTQHHTQLQQQLSNNELIHMK